MKARIHNLPDGLADDVHLIGCEPIAAREVARGAGRSNVALYMWQGIVNSVKTARASLCAAIDAGLPNEGQDFCSAKVAGVDFLVCGPQKDCPALIGLGVSLLARNNLFPLFWRMLRPSVGSLVTPALPVAVAGPAFISQPKRARGVTQEDVCCRWQKLLATVAVSEAIFWRDKPFSHRGLVA